MNTTLQQLVSDVRAEIKIDPSGTIASDTLIEQNLNKALRKIQEDTSYDLADNASYTTISLQNGTAEYDLPADFKRMAEPSSVKIGDSNPVYPSDYTTLLGLYNMENQAGTPSQYYIRKVSGTWKIGFYPTPNSGSTATVPYLASLPEMTSSQDNPLPSEYDEVMVLYAAYLTLRRITGYEAQSTSNYQAYKELSKSLLANTLSYNRHSLRFGTQRRARGVAPNPKAITGNTFNSWY